MNARDYLQQGFYLDKKIESNLREVAELRNLCMGISAAGLEESHNPNRPQKLPLSGPLKRSGNGSRKSTGRSTGWWI